MDLARRGADPAFIRHWNECAVVEALRRSGPQKVSDLRATTGITPGPLGQVLKGLEDKQWVQSRRAEIVGPGRPPQIFSLAEPAGYVIGIEISATDLRMSRCGVGGEIDKRYEQPFDPRSEPAAVHAAIRHGIDRLLFDGCKSIWAVTIALNAHVTEQGSMVDCPALQDLLGPDPAQTLGRGLPVPMTTVSRMYALLRAEMGARGADSADDMLLVDPIGVSTVGAVVGGSPLWPPHRTRWLRHDRHLEAQLRAIRDGDDQAQAALVGRVEEGAASLGLAISVLGPDRVIVTVQEPAFREPVITLIREAIERDVTDPPPVEGTACPPSAVADGAALLARDRVQNTLLSHTDGALPLTRQEFLARAR